MHYATLPGIDAITTFEAESICLSKFYTVITVLHVQHVCTVQYGVQHVCMYSMYGVHYIQYYRLQVIRYHKIPDCSVTKLRRSSASNSGSVRLAGWLAHGSTRSDRSQPEYSRCSPRHLQKHHSLNFKVQKRWLRQNICSVDYIQQHNGILRALK
jgi:hypothetical protein